MVPQAFGDRRRGHCGLVVRSRSAAHVLACVEFLLASDVSRRSLRTWEADQPCPSPESATEHIDARIVQCQAGIEFTNEMFPDSRGMLPTLATGPQECVVIMASTFRSQFFEMIA